MPKGKAPTPSRTPTKTPAATGPTLDLSAWKRQNAAPSPAAPTGRAAPAATAQAEREKRPRASWEQLVGIADLQVVDAFDGTDPTYGDYVAALVRLPPNGGKPAVDVLVITNSATTAGKALAAAMNGFEYDEKGEMTPVDVFARARASRMYPDGHPRVLLTFGK